MTQLCSAQHVAEAGSWALGQFLDAPLPVRRLRKDSSR